MSILVVDRDKRGKKNISKYGQVDQMKRWRPNFAIVWPRRVIRGHFWSLVCFLFRFEICYH